ncbi:MAG: hypothetical protein KDK41_03815 [Leptospiraceae bacterium]|nr:hypothetical protein [Leptospiraceae bacterium]
MRKFLTALLCACLLQSVFAQQYVPSSQASSLEPEPFSWQNTTAARYNPLGLFNETRLSYRHWLYDASQEPILKGSHLGASAVLFTSPALVQAGADLEAAPLAILNLTVGYRAVGYFGAFGMQQGYGSPAADWSDKQRSDQSGLAQSSFGNMFTAGVQTQVRFGNIVLRNLIRGFWQRQNLNVRAGESQVAAFYDPVLDVLQPNGGLSIVNDADLLWLASDHWTVGIRYNFSRAYYDNGMLSATERALADESAFQQRIGPLITYRLEPDPDRTAPAPMLILLVQVHLNHRFRTGGINGDPFSGQAVSQAVPYVALAYRMAGDF